MPTPVSADMVRLVPHGTIRSAQTWSVGLWVEVELGGAWGVNSFNSYAAAMEAYCRTWWATAKLINAPTTEYTGTDAYFYLSGATTASQVASVPGGAAVAGTFANYVPTQVSIVASLRTAVSSRSGRGRIYIPATAAPLGTDHQITSAVATTQGAAVVALLGSLNAYTSAPYNIDSQVASVRSGVLGAANPILTVHVDTEPDIQRRRADALSPTATYVGSV